MALHEYSDFSRRRVLVTGAAHGLGAAIAGGFARHGGSLVLADCDGDALRRTAARLGGLAECHEFDQGDLESIQRLAAAIGDIHVLVNNAGVIVRAPLLETERDVLRETIEVDLIGVIVLTQLIARRMVDRGGGVVINVGSQMAFCGAAGRGVYAAAKAAISQFTRTAAVEWGPRGVRVNCIAPGRMLTRATRAMLEDPEEYARGLERIPLRRYGEPEDVANVAVFLASDAAAYITGQTIIVDGGWLLG